MKGWDKFGRRGDAGLGGSGIGCVCLVWRRGRKTNRGVVFAGVDISGRLALISSVALSQVPPLHFLSNRELQDLFPPPLVP